MIFVRNDNINVNSLLNLKRRKERFIQPIETHEDVDCIKNAFV